MVVLSDNGIEAKTRLNTAIIDSKGITVEKSMTHIIYSDKALHKALEPLVCRVALQNDWVYPDYDTVKTRIVIDPSKLHPIQLLIEVEPPQYTEQDKSEILHHASTEPIYIDSDVTMYSVWLDIFKAAESFHNGNTGDIENRIECCYIDMTEAEEKRFQKRLLTLLLQLAEWIAMHRNSPSKPHTAF